VRRCGDAYGFTPDEHVHALRIALADSAEALACFRKTREDLRQLEPFGVSDKVFTRSIARCVCARAREEGAR
jgi:hypothetical protein